MLNSNAACNKAHKRGTLSYLQITVKKVEPQFRNIFKMCLSHKYDFAVY